MQYFMSKDSCLMLYVKYVAAGRHVDALHPSGHLDTCQDQGVATFHSGHQNCAINHHCPAPSYRWQVAVDM